MQSRNIVLVSLGVLAVMPRAGWAQPPGELQDSVVELRSYKLRPGQRETLISLFEREFVESQEAVGSRIVGSFRDLDASDRFVWIRSFRSPACLEAHVSIKYVLSSIYLHTRQDGV